MSKNTHHGVQLSQHETSDGYMWAIARDKRARIVHAKDGESYKVQRTKGAGWWRTIETCETRVQLLWVVRRSFDTFDDGGPLVRSDYLRACAEALPHFAGEFIGDGSGIQAAAREALGQSLAVAKRKPKAASRPNRRQRDAVRRAGGQVDPSMGVGHQTGDLAPRAATGGRNG